MWQLGSILFEMLTGNTDFIQNNLHREEALLLQRITGLNVSTGKKTNFETLKLLV